MARFMRAIHFPFFQKAKLDGPDKPGHDAVWGKLEKIVQHHLGSPQSRAMTR
jgi:hypothetical protein